ncbi:MAG TPA: adenylate/guanylate cyclase domain-containing protein [Spirochaetia bacterium]|nr:adenylate/guanylate cyclase domain-containing protein [Spirochaetia bacterium]
MRIRAKIIWIVLPLLIAALLITGIISSESARNGITKVAVAALGFKAQELNKYMESQWNLLVQNNLSDSADYVQVAQNAVASYAATIIRSKTELIFAVNSKGAVTMSTTPNLTLSTGDTAEVLKLFNTNYIGWVDLTVAGVERVGQTFYYQPFGWYVFVTEEKQSFYQDVTNITVQSAVILAASCLLSLILLILFSSYLTRPLTHVVSAMKRTIQDNDLTSRVEVEYKDEIGELANTFNIMIGGLEKAYRQIKEFALQAVIAQKNERKIRSIFQKYVPTDVIDNFFTNPESMLVGENRVLAVLFSDIRSFTTISEGFMPDELVVALNKYFSVMVDIIMGRGGIVDKYIGDAIMAFYGAPVHHEDDALQAVLAAIEMQEALKDFNLEQTRIGKPEFRIGLGINYGVVTVGNIGSEKKMDYTVIGDMVNLASRLEGLTKKYKQEILVSTSVYRKIKNKLPCRLVDKVVVKGKTQGEKIFTVKRSLSESEERGWKLYHEGLKAYYIREFPKALDLFEAAGRSLGDDHLCDLFRERCATFMTSPPPAEWEGMEVMTEK